MNLYQRLVSKFNFRNLTNTRAKKVISTATLTVAVTAGLWGYNTLSGDHLTIQPSLDTFEAFNVAEQPAEPATRGLSRQRKDFDKALSLLADVGSDNRTLAEYKERVNKRVNGEIFLIENGSGVRVVKARKKAASAVASNAPVTEAAPEQKREAPSAWAKLKGFMSSTIGASSPEEPAVAAGARLEASGSAASHKPSKALAPGLTVGDVAFNMNPAIEKWINYYTATNAGRSTMRIGIERSDAYLEMAREEFRRLGVPEDLVWLAHVESVWHSKAMSPAAAGGIWQFIPRTATDYGLTVAEGNDERLDPLKQTRVAAYYLSDLHTIFGDWALAMAAYNCGEPRVMEAIIKNGRANFWELYDKQLLPKETRNYVPKILAAIKVASQADNYGLMADSASDAESAGR
jgi:hypothetical protein